MNTQKKKNRKQLAKASAAVVTAGSLVVGGLFAEPAELLDTDAADGIVESEVMEEDSSEVSEERGLRQRLRRRILALPLFLRAGVFLPLWALGWALAELLPLGARPLGLTAAALGAACAAGKLLRPDLPLKELLSRRRIALTLLLLGTLWASDALLPLLWEDYDRFRQLLWGLASLGFGAALLFPLPRKEAAVPPPETQEEALRRVLAMADEAGKR